MYDMQVVIVCDALETYSDDGLLREKLVEWTPKTDSSKKRHNGTFNTTSHTIAHTYIRVLYSIACE